MNETQRRIQIHEAERAAEVEDALDLADAAGRALDRDEVARPAIRAAECGALAVTTDS
jgi:hypothetical protein